MGQTIRIGNRSFTAAIMLSPKSSFSRTSWALPALYLLFFLSGFTALLYQVVWQRMLGLFSGSDVRSVTIVVAAYLSGLGLGSLLGGLLSDRLSSHRAVQTYGLCNLGIAIFAILSRFLFYDLLFRQLRAMAQSPALMLSIVFVSLLIPTILMGVSLPLLSRAIGRKAIKAAPRIGLLYGLNTLGSGLGTLISGWYMVGTWGYEKTLYLGAALSILVGLIALVIANQFAYDRRFQTMDREAISSSHQSGNRWVVEWCLLVFFSGFIAISLEIIWFRVLDVALQSTAYTYAHLLAFILVSNGLGSLLGAKTIHFINKPRPVFLLIQGIVPAYSAIAIWLIALYWQGHPELRSDIGYIDPNNLGTAVVFKYVVLPLVMMVVPNLLLGFYFPVVQKAIQTDDRKIGQRVGLIQIANILGNTTGSLLTGLILLDQWGTADSLRLLVLLGLGFVLLLRLNWIKAKLIGMLVIVLIGIAVFFPTNTRLWADLHGIKSQQYFIVAEDSTGVAAIAEADQQGILFASGQAQAHFPYFHAHAQLGSIPALIHPHPRRVLIIGLGSGGTAHTIGANPLTQEVNVVELLGAELTVLREYAKSPVGKPLSFLFRDPRYRFVVGDGRQELSLANRQFDIIEADAIQPWRSRAGMLYSQEFFQEVRSHLAPGGMFVEWNVTPGETFRNVFPYVVHLYLNGNLSVLLGSNRPIDFNREKLLSKLASPAVVSFLRKAGVNIEALRKDVKMASVTPYPQTKDGQPQAFNTDLFPRSEYYLNNPSPTKSP
jgi:spermidine synthase